MSPTGARQIYLDRLFAYEDAAMNYGAHPSAHAIDVLLCKRRELSRVVADYGEALLVMLLSASDRPLAADDVIDDQC